MRTMPGATQPADGLPKALNSHQEEAPWRDCAGQADPTKHAGVTAGIYTGLFFREYVN